MKQFFAEIFIWWHKQTMGMRLHTWASGKHVGTDETGNRYYLHKKNGTRWVIYNGPAEASAIPPGWHGWMHYRTDVLPDDDNYKPYAWQKAHQSNLTGTAMAYRPEGSLLKSGVRAKVVGDYDAWSPEE